MRNVNVIPNALKSFFSLEQLPNTHEGKKLMKET